MSMIFEDLEAWQAARKTLNLVYNLTREGSLARDFGLKDQILIEDNFPDLLPQLPAIRQENALAASKLTGLITSYRKRQAFTTIAPLAILATSALIFFFNS